MTYKPAPIDASHIELSQELKDLIEMLARNNHELWARRRIEEGWSYGPQRDDIRKQTPALVPYEDLPESEKAYDRDNAVETLKVILAFGGGIDAPPAAEKPEAGGVAVLLAAWHARKPRQLSLRQYHELGKRAHAMGECLIAFDVADEGLKNWPADAELLRIKALALARMGSREQAFDILSQLKQDDEETLGLVARTHKDEWLKTGDPQDLEEAYEAYARAYDRAPARYWTGINAATLAYAKGDREAAASHAAQIRQVCVEALKSASGDERYWIVATLAEASLVLEDVAEAELRYAEASQIAGNDTGHLGATWRNAGILLRYMALEVRNRIERALRMPKVAVFAGHRIDEPQRCDPRFPNELSAAVKNAIAERLIRLNARIGYSSAASGSDILFLEAMQGIGGQTHIVLPCSEEQFVRESVASSGPEWEHRFRNVLGKAQEVVLASDQRLRFGGIAYDYANELLYGLATIRTEQLQTELERLAVWDGQPGYGPGGTADIVSRWQAGGRDVEIINPLDLMPARARPTLRQAASVRSEVPGLASEIRAMIFADAYHFSRLTEEQIPDFTTHFMGPVAALAKEAEPKPVYQNTWGDGLFFVFEKASDAGRFALALAARVAGIDRAAAGLPEALSLRIAVHAGPVYRFEDRITGKLNYIGSHVNRAARIEPVTPPGKVYASDAFAALASLEAPGRFQFDYVGRIPLAKSFGEFPMFHMRASY